MREKNMTTNNEDNNDIPGILILSHGQLCNALISSAKMINGEMYGVVALPFEEGMNLKSYTQNAKTILMGMPEGSVILFDLFSGTPFNQLLLLYNDVKIYGLCGASLPMLLDALMFRETMRGAELVKELEKSAHASIVNVGEFLEKASQSNQP
jgi:PTS system mannose-specific IIA component/D-glucosaminate-specific PTS system IIA component